MARSTFEAPAIERLERFQSWQCEFHLLTMFTPSWERMVLERAHLQSIVQKLNYYGNKRGFGNLKDDEDDFFGSKNESDGLELVFAGLFASTKKNIWAEAIESLDDGVPGSDKSFGMNKGQMIIEVIWG
uniref:Uncharacterized protein n=1 Tax=Cucumis melo TaxID=3656 RepID=A0A9I9E7N7_CUCME